jgi:hypothetical protein
MTPLRSVAAPAYATAITITAMIGTFAWIV